jgi:hypothetical protein
MRGGQGGDTPDRLKKRLHDAAFTNSRKPGDAHGASSIPNKSSGFVEGIREISDRLVALDVEDEALLANQIIRFSFGC